MSRKVAASHQEDTEALGKAIRKKGEKDSPAAHGVAISQ